MHHTQSRRDGEHEKSVSLPEIKPVVKPWIGYYTCWPADTAFNHDFSATASVRVQKIYMRPLQCLRDLQPDQRRNNEWSILIPY